MVVLAVGLIAVRAEADEILLSGGLDGRAAAGTDDGAELSAFVNLRATRADERGDRIVGVFQVDIEAPEFDESHLYQAYGEYKGPLGRWNLRAGRFFLPYGLLARYDSEREILRTSEALVLGLKLDEGAQIHGIAGEWDWAAAVTQGVGDGSVRTIRFGRETDDGGAYGFSYLAGHLPRFATDTTAAIGKRLAGEPVQRKRRIGFDAEFPLDRLLLRLEADAGTDNGHRSAGGFFSAAYAIDKRWTATASYGRWGGFPARLRWGAALTKQLRPDRRFSAGYVRRKENGDERLAVLQFYWEFSRGL